MTPHSLELDIESLVLHGFPHADREAIGAALQQELTRLLTEHGIPTNFAGGGETRSLDGGSFTLSAGTGGAHVGVQIAQTLYQGWQK